MPAAAAALETLRRQYFALVPPYLLRVPAPAELASADAQQFLVSRVLESDLPPPEAGYQRTFWRRVLPVLEEGAVDERIYEAVAQLMAAPSNAAAPPASHKTFIYDLAGQERAVTLLEEQVVVQAGTTGLRTWTAALFLAHYLLAGNLGPVPAAIELGAGTGFLAAVLAQLGADVIATDLGDEEGEEEGEGQRRTPLGRLTANLALNNLPSPARAAALDWADAALSPEDRPPIWAEALAPVNGARRTVVAADVIYDPDLVPLLAGAIDLLISPAGEVPPPVAIIAATVRNEDTFALFLAECEKRHLSTQLLDLASIDDAPTFWDTALDRGTRVQVVRISKQ
ncbi:Protein-lysine N-methyltransferase EFM3 [Vanrija pseudolonga]|uniref:Protein-lysine N-methyltransferase EFM3 n=1 Tax=Vanrija pseudolonga TaxID=143232 RepID=A0AAF0YJ24_9TREE|nr:Protein-lysine N-methyltransferase EFM3 [Vanrija pseudolonga]